MPSSELSLVSMVDNSRTMVDIAVAASCSEFIKDGLEISGEQEAEEGHLIELNATREVIEEVVAFMNTRASTAAPRIPKPLPANALRAILSTTDREFVDKWDTDMLIELIKVSNHLCFEALKCLACASLANIMMKSSADEVRAILGVTKDLTEEEEYRLRDEHGIPQLPKKEEPSPQIDSEQKELTAAAAEHAEVAAENAEMAADAEVAADLSETPVEESKEE